MYLKMRGLRETGMPKLLSGWIDDPCAGVLYSWVCTFHNSVNQWKGGDYP